MKSKNIILQIGILLTFTVVQLFANTNPTVTNVSFLYNEATNIITVTYDVADAEQNSFTIYMEVSENSGTDWDFDYGSASGEIGTSISGGTDKEITFSYSGSNSPTMKIKILADDLFGDQIYYSYQVYNTVNINGQIWLKENLNVGTMIISDGSHTGQQMTSNSTIEKYCYNNDAANCETYGGLYEWNEAMQYVTTEGTQGICPSGWHIPTYSEMQTLQTFVNDEATKLIDENANSNYTYTNETGFSALFAGYRYNSNGSFYNLGYYATFWSSTENSSSYAYHMRLKYNNSDVFFYSYDKGYGFSVRCLKD